MSSLTALIYRRVSAKQTMTIASVEYEPSVFAILNSFWCCKERKVIFAIESTRTLEDSCVQSVQCRDSSQRCESFKGALRSEHTKLMLPTIMISSFPFNPFTSLRKKLLTSSDIKPSISSKTRRQRSISRAFSNIERMSSWSQNFLRDLTYKVDLSVDREARERIRALIEIVFPFPGRSWRMIPRYNYQLNRFKECSVKTVRVRWTIDFECMQDGWGNEMP